jgi:hypothetical protein
MTNPYSLDQAKQKVTDYTTQKFGRGPQNDQEWGEIGKGINYGDGVDDAELQQAYGNADTYAKSLGWQPPQQQQTPGPQTSPIQSAFQDSLMGLFQRANQTPTLDDPVLRGQSDAFRTAQQRGAERRRAGLAERMAAEGTIGGGGFNVGLNQIDAARTNAEASFDADLLGDETTARRNELIQALQIAAQSRGLDINQMLGTGDLDLRRLGITQQGQLGRGDLALRLMLGLMGNQFNYDQLGTQNAQWLADYNQRAFDSYFKGL